ncbi:thiocillin family RiPP [Streptomyces sp. NPDC087218]
MSDVNETTEEQTAETEVEVDELNATAATVCVFTIGTAGSFS